jgi:ATP-dependent phosphoenolpyruvate carboxykinase
VLEYDDEIHRQLYLEAHISASKPILRNGLFIFNIISLASVPVLYEEALQYEKGTALMASGALMTNSGEKKGRSPKDKRIVEESETKDIWWGPVNAKMTEHTFMINRERAVDFLEMQPRLYVFDGFAGWYFHLLLCVGIPSIGLKSVLFVRVLTMHYLCATC